MIGLDMKYVPADKAQILSLRTRINTAVRDAMEEIAVNLVSDIKDHIIANDLGLEPLSRSTIARKKLKPSPAPFYANTPWIESGAFRDALDFWWEGYGRGMSGVKKTIAVGIPETATKTLSNGNTIKIRDYASDNEMKRPLIDYSSRKFFESGKIDKILHKHFPKDF